MPELPEVEAYRQLADSVVGRRVTKVDAPDAWYLKSGLTATELRRAVRGRHIEAARRIGKLLLLDLSDGAPSVGLRFGMTGRLIVDGIPGIDHLIYSSRRDDPAWDRLRLTFAGGGHLRINDARRLGAVVLGPDEGRLGTDAATMSLRDVRAALGASTAPLKARLLDQARFAGVGNLIADEVLFRAGLDPRRSAGSLDAGESRRLHRHLRGGIAELIGRGGSHTGDFLPHRVAGGHCPRDGAPLERATVGGRTTYWCPVHQR